jgi:hypothetical protein
MKEPCKNCPFRADREFGGLHPNRARDIAIGIIYGDSDFACHKTVDYSGDSPQTTEQSKRCFGAALFAENVAPGGVRANVCFRLALMAGEFRLEDINNCEVPTYDSIEDFCDAVSDY